MTYIQTMERVDELKLDALSGAIPTWYCYEQIARLMQDLNSSEEDKIMVKDTKTQWLLDTEIETLAQDAISKNVKLEDAINALRANNYEVGGRKVYIKKFCKYYYAHTREDEVKSFFK